MWVCCPHDAAARALAKRLEVAEAADIVRVAGRPDEVDPDAAAVLLVPSTPAGRLGPIGELLAIAPQATVIIPVRRPTVADVVSALRTGAQAVVDLDDDDPSFAHGIRAAVRDGSYVPAKLQAAVVATVERRRREDPLQRARIATLKPGERQVLELLAAGSDRGGIAARLGEPVSRIRVRIDRAKAKLGVASQREAVAIVVRHLNRSD